MYFPKNWAFKNLSNFSKGASLSLFPEAVEEDEAIELTAQQKEALDKELAAIAANPGYLQK